MENLEKFETQELSMIEREEINGGGWLADVVEWILCECNQMTYISNRRLSHL